MSITLHQALAGASFGELWNGDHVGTVALAFALAYLAVTGPLSGRFRNGRPATRLQRTYFLLGCLGVYAIGSPLDLISDNYLFSAHMLEHVLLIWVVPPLWLRGLPAWLVDAIVGHGRFRRFVAAVTKPFPALALLLVVFSLWHFPGPYNLTLENDTVHLTEHAMFVAIGLIAWWPLLSPLPDLPPLPPAARLVYLFMEEVMMTVPFAIITFAPRPLYSFYFHAPRLWGITLLQDQVWGGIVMRLGMMATMGYAFFHEFWAWAHSEPAIDPIPERPVHPASVRPQHEAAGNLNP